MLYRMKRDLSSTLDRSLNDYGNTKIDLIEPRDIPPKMTKLQYGAKKNVKISNSMNDTYFEKQMEIFLKNLVTIPKTYFGESMHFVTVNHRSMDT